MISGLTVWCYKEGFIQIFPPCPLRLLDFGIQRSDIMAYFNMDISLTFNIKL